MSSIRERIKNRVKMEASVAPGDLVTITNVPVLETGIEYPASTGPFTPTSEMLLEAVNAQEDPHVPPPRIKIAHLENPMDADLQEMFEAARAEQNDGEPAVGTIQNLRTSEDGQTLIGDWVGLPAWLAAIAESAYPARSIEGGAWKNPANDKEYDFMIEAVSLLGVHWPGCTSLADLQELFSEDGPDKLEIITMSKGGTMSVQAQVNVGDIRRAFYDDFAQGDRYWWWDRELLVNPNEFIVEDPDENQLYRVPFNLVEQSGDEPDLIEFGEPEAIKIKYVPDKKAKQDKTEAAVALVSPQLDHHGTVVAANGKPPRERERANANKEASVDQNVIQELRRIHGLSEDQLPDDATEEQLSDALAAIETPDAETPPAETPPEGGDEEGDGEEEGGDGEPGGSTAPNLPEGMTLIDNETLKGLQEGAKEGVAANKRLREEDTKKVLDDGIKAGKFPPSRRDHYAKLMAADPEGTRALIANLAAGTIPVDERGGAGDVEEFGETDAYPAHWLPDVQARKAAAAAGASPGPVAFERDPKGR